MMRPRLQCLSSVVSSPAFLTSRMTKMAQRKLAFYYAWSRTEEIGAPLPIIENRFPALFESRRMLYPRFEEFSDPSRFDQGIGGFLDHIMKANFADFVAQATAQTGHAVIEVE